MADNIIFKSIPEQIEEHLRRDILSGSLTPGQPLREQEISERFGVSRGPIREVLSKLTQQGLVVAEPNKGVRIASQPSESVRPLLVDLRKTIELFVLDSIFDKITKKDLKAWEKNLSSIKKACKKGDKAALVEHDLSFHKAIIQSHDDTDLFTLWHPIVLRMLIHYDRLGDLMESYHEHKAILDAIKAKDKKKALDALARNIQ
ncbi:MAG: GntR family transcriptional regulator [Deinococcota bacterium]